MTAFKMEKNVKKTIKTLGAGIQVYHTLKLCIELLFLCHFATP